MTDTAPADDLADAYERGRQDGWDEGYKAGVEKARAIVDGVHTYTGFLMTSWFPNDKKEDGL